MSSQNQLSSLNFIDWSTSDVCRFISQHINKKQLDITKMIQKHQLIGIDLLDLTEQNLMELGIQSIHERKNILRQIQNLKVSPYTEYGVIKVKLMETSQELKLRIIDPKIKIKHIMKQAYDCMKEKCYEKNQYCMTFGQDSYMLQNDCEIESLLYTGKEIELFIERISKFADKADPSSINSPIRILQKAMNNSVEKQISSPQAIYVQPIDDADEVLQLNSSESEFQLQKNLKSGQKTSSKTIIKNPATTQNKKKKIVVQSSNSGVSTNRVSESQSHHTLQNYITSNKPNKKPQQVLPSQLINAQHGQFQYKKNSINEQAAFNYTGGITGLGSYSNQINVLPAQPLSRGNSMKKMKTFSNGGGSGMKPQAPLQNSKSKKDCPKSNSRHMNMYSTMGNNLKNQTNSEEFMVQVNNEYMENQMNQRLTPGQAKSSKESKNRYSNSRVSGVSSNTASYLNHHSKSHTQSKHGLTGNKINNLNEIFCDFLDEQTKIIAPTSGSKKKSKSKPRTDHSRQHILQDEDSLEKTKTPQMALYLLTDQPQLQDCSQRAVKHMAHKSMYALNSNSVKSKQNKSHQSSSKNGGTAHYGTFDNSVLGSFLCSQGPQQSDHMQNNIALKENFNFYNIYNNRVMTEIDDNKENIEVLGERINNTKFYKRSDSNPTKHKNNRYSDACDDLLMLDMSEDDGVITNNH